MTVGPETNVGPTANYSCYVLFGDDVAVAAQLRETSAELHEFAGTTKDWSCR